MTLADFMAKMSGVPGGKSFFARLDAKTFDQFVKVLHDDIDDIIKLMEANPHRHRNDSEDKLTFFIASMLKQRHYRAELGVVRGGSVDLTVEGLEEEFVWICEAKIFNSISSVQEGFLQLAERYRPADNLNAKAGMLIYIARPNSVRLMDSWMKKIKTMSMSDITVTACTTRPKLSFFSNHTARHSGLPVHVRHMSVTLFQDPIDKSGRQAKVHKDARAASSQNIAP
jgi:hypothetical protein